MTAPLSGAEKTALLLLLLEEPEAGAMLARLAPEEVDTIGRAMLRVSEATPGTIDGLLDEVLALSRQTVAVGEGPPSVRQMFGRALGPDRSIGALERLGADARAPLFERLQWLEPAGIAVLLAGEHPQAQALVLANMPEAAAGRLLAALPADTRADIVGRVAMLCPVAPAVVETLDAALTRRLLETPPRQPVEGIGGIARAASLVNLSGMDETEALAVLEAADTDAARALADQLFTFADLAKLPDRALQAVMRALDADVLIPALRAAAPDVRAKLLGGMPQRAAEALADEIANRGPVKMDEAETAQKAIAAAARAMAADGTISLPGKGPAFV